MAKGRSNRSFKHGLFGGWDEFRYGGKPITLAKPKAIYKGQKRQHLVDQAIDVLRDWRMSPFEHEAAVRHGIRSSLVLDGHGWGRSDEEAAEVVAAGLRSIGAVHPTWEQGQREYVVSRDQCAWCYGPMPEAAANEGRTDRFCSAACARRAFLQRDHEDQHAYRQAHAKMMAVVKRAERPAAECLKCGTSFQPMRIKGQLTRFCSRTCAWDHQRVPKKRCAQCGSPFRPQKGQGNVGTFCSWACKTAHGSLIRIEMDCDWCGRAFVAKQASARCCSHACTSKRYNLYSGKRTPRVISGQVFDFIARQAGLRITSDRMAA